jgi:CelD/BcsL family acetyltransferase involved in cellulose biosynthesis
MSLGLSPSFVDLPWSDWERQYPDGLGVSAFSSPGFQRLMQAAVGPEYELRGLVAEDGDRRYTLPVFVRQWRFRRLELVCYPIAYYVLPIECDGADADCVPAVVAAARRPLTSTFKWWLPPWLRGERALAAPDVDTFVIEVEGDPDAFLERTVRKRTREYVRASHRRGIEIVEAPSASEIDEYYALYERTFTERQWVGDAFSRAFFAGVASELGQGGKLVLLRHRDRVVGGGVVLFDRYAVHYFQGATERDNAEVRPHLVLYDWLVRAAAARGLRYVNLGGINAGNDSLEQFKLSWGAKPMSVPHVYWSIDRKWLKERLGLGALGSRFGLAAPVERPLAESATLESTTLDAAPPEPAVEPR